MSRLIVIVLILILTTHSSGFSNQGQAFKRKTSVATVVGGGNIFHNKGLYLNTNLRKDDYGAVPFTLRNLCPVGEGVSEEFYEGSDIVFNGK